MDQEINNSSILSIEKAKIREAVEMKRRFRQLQLGGFREEDNLPKIPRRKKEAN